MSKVVSVQRLSATLLTDLVDKPRDFFRQVAREKIAFALSTQDKNVKFTLAIDGRPVPGGGDEAISKANKRVLVNFPGNALEVAVAIVKDELRKLIRRYGVNPEEASRMASLVRVFWFQAPRNGQAATITDNVNVASVDLQPGDYVDIYISYPRGDRNTAVYENYFSARKYQGKGFFGRTTQRIRRKLRINPRNSPIRVAAVRSFSAGKYTKQPISPIVKPGGIPKDLAVKTVWVIRIGWKRSAL